LESSVFANEPISEKKDVGSKYSRSFIIHNGGKKDWPLKVMIVNIDTMEKIEI
jgi:hypothetical protein